MFLKATHSTREEVLAEAEKYGAKVTQDFETVYIDLPKGKVWKQDGSDSIQATFDSEEEPESEFWGYFMEILRWGTA